MRNQWCFGFLCVWQFCDFLCSLVFGAGLPLVFHASVCCVSQGFSHSSNWLSSIFQCCCLRLLASPFGGYGKEGWTVPSINWSGLLWFVLETCECSVAALLYSWQVSLAKKKNNLLYNRENPWARPGPYGGRVSGLVDVLSRWFVVYCMCQSDIGLTRRMWGRVLFRAKHEAKERRSNRLWQTVLVCSISTSDRKKKHLWEQ